LSNYARELHAISLRRIKRYKREVRNPLPGNPMGFRQNNTLENIPGKHDQQPQTTKDIGI
jgi:hypothetical protein